MKTKLNLLAAGFLFLAICLAGCLNSVSFGNPDEAESGAEETAARDSAGGAGEEEPFILTVVVDAGDAPPRRSLAGPSLNQIDKGPGVRNYVQIIVLDDAKNVVAAEDLLNGGTGNNTITIKGVTCTNEYTFLALAGHWQRNYAAGYYRYVEGVPPTLLAAGCVTAAPTGGTINIEMYSVKLGTSFTGSSSGKIVEPVITDGKPRAVILDPEEDWAVTWEIKGTGINYLFKAAEKNIDTIELEDFAALFPPGDRAGILRIGGDPVDPAPDVAYVSPKKITLNIDAKTLSQAAWNTPGSVNFNLWYKAFNGAAGINWDKLDRPVQKWIIRNGINDEAQNAGTVFDETTAWAGTTKDTPNGNGAVRFVTEPVHLDPDNPPPTDPALAITGGAFENPGAAKPAAYIAFTTGGSYDGAAEAYYAVVSHGGGAPELSAYTGRLGTGFVKGTAYTGQLIRLEDSAGAAHSNADIYVILAKDGKVSGPAVIWTRSGNGGAWDWGADDEGAPVTGITMTSAATAYTNAALTLTGAIQPANATWRNIVWTVQNAGTAGASISRDAAGAYILNTTATGTVTVRAEVPHAEWDPAASPAYRDFTITVQAPLVPISSIGLSASSKTIDTGSSFTLTATVGPSSNNDTLTWSVSNSKVSLSGSGNSRTVKAGSSSGTAVITVASALNSSVKATCTVTVAAVSNSADSITIYKNVSTKEIYAASYSPPSEYTVIYDRTISTGETLLIYVDNDYADDQKSSRNSVSVSSGNSSVATVNGGSSTNAIELDKITIKGVSKGTATITASGGGKSCSFTITVQ
ncbi:MAG: hypothetical protein LBP80_00170 [Treponema sp.]|jgi:hypothetical protein|nr:hypothetical protein [Treponema sp.]